MENEPETITEIKQDVARYRNRLAQDWNDIRSAVNPREVIEDVIRENPMASISAAAIAGVIAASAILPPGKRSPIGLLAGGLMTLAYRGMFMAATPIVAKRVAELVDPPKSQPAPAPVPTPSSIRDPADPFPNHGG